MSHQELVRTAVDAARAGAAALEPFEARRSEMDVSEKRMHDFVTEADLAAERAIRELIEARHPVHRILGEEGERIDLDDPAPTWIVDPLDGTTNFIHGLPIYAVSIGCAVDGRVVAGAVLDPSRGELFVAERGAGAYVGERRVRVSACETLAGSLLATGFPFRTIERADVYFEGFKEILRIAAGIRRPGSAALDLASVAAGRTDGFWEEGLGPWDIAAGSLLIEEAGGVVTDFVGGGGAIETGAIVAGTPGVHAELREIVHRHLGEGIRLR
jgi:myo-inositol-1(or 4)-monophosphatase